MPGMDIVQLEYFLAVARSENMTTAAASLHVAQSSVSRCISRLEDHLGVPLFDRSGNGITLNENGKAFYPHAEAIIREMADGSRKMKEMRDQSLGRVSISTCAARQINQLIIRHMEQYPDILFRQRRCTDSEEIQRLLDRGMLDYALTFTPLSEHDYTWTPLVHEKYFVLVPAKHPLVVRKSVSITDLDGVSILINDSDSPDHIEDQFQKHGVTPRFAFIGNEFEALGPMVERGIGAALISTLALYDMKQGVPLENLARIRVLPLQEKLPRTLGIVSRKHHYMSQSAKVFYQTLVRYFRDIEQDMNLTANTGAM